MTDEYEYPTKLPSESGSHPPPSDPSTASLNSTREAGVPADESTIWSAELPPTAAPTQTWDWQTIVKFAAGDQATKPHIREAKSDSDERTLPDRPRFQLDGYEVLEEVGRGGMGIVYKARRLLLGNLVALKVLPAAFASDGERLERFINEGKIAAGLDDHRLLPVHHIEWADGVPVLVMPYVEGGDLNKIIRAHRHYFRKGRAPANYPSASLAPGKRAYVQKILPLLDQLVEAVGLMHDAGILHRDIKPSNCLIDGRGNLRLSDFGLARLKTGTRMTTTRSGMGTPGYMSPEAWDGKEDLDEKADVFGLGVTLYHAFTFELPYGQGSIGESHTAANAGFAKGVPELVDLEPLILHALDPDRSTRYSSEGFRKDWKRVRAGLLPEYRRPNVLRRSMRWVKRKRTAVLATLAALVCVAAAAAWPVVFPPPPPDPLAPQPVVLDTTKPCGRYAFVLLDSNTGEPDPTSPATRRGRGTGDRLLRLSLRPGMYLVVVEWPDGRFHEVLRRVPAGYDTNLGLLNPSHFVRHGDGVVEVPGLEPPRNLDQVENHTMALVKASDLPGVEPVDDFWIDTREFSVDQFLALRKSQNLPPTLPRGMTTGKEYEEIPPGNTALYNLEWQEAAHHLEMLGKRLPTFAEYVHAIGGDCRALGWRGVAWPIGSVDNQDLDRIDATPPLFGLRSNLGEWTSTWASNTAPRNVTVSSDVTTKRLVFGAPASVVSGLADPAEREADLCDRVILPWRAHWGQKRDKTPFWVGFRGARSARPRFLGP